MPEGDSYVRAARRIRPPLVGHEIQSITGTSPAVRKWSGRLIGRRVEAVRTHGKRILIDVEGEVTVSVWLGMPGRIYVSNAGAAPGSARMVLRTGDHDVIVEAAPRIEVERRRIIDRRLSHLGPDLVAADFDSELVLDRAMRHAGTVAELLLDQRVAAGIGNVFRCEVLFLEGIHPLRATASLGPDVIASLFHRARRLLLASSTIGEFRGRDTTGLGGDRRTWVYGRAGKPCRRCRSAVIVDHVGTPSRLCYWCPTCQPA